MKVTRKLQDLGTILKAVDGEHDELAPNLHLSELPKALDGMPDKGHFEGRIKGKVRGHTIKSRDGKTTHHYDLDVTHLECQKPSSPKDSVDKAFERWKAEEATEPEHKK